MNWFRCSVSFVLACLAMHAPSVLAQGGRLPDPPPPPPPPVDRNPGRIENIEEFVAAYKRAQRPKMIFYTETCATGARFDLTKAKPGEDRDEYRRMIAAQFGGRLQALFQARDVQIMSVDAAAFNSEKKQELMRLNGDYAAAEFVKRETNADVVVMVRLSDLGGWQWDASYAVLDGRTGQQLGTWPWQMKPGEGEQTLTVDRVHFYANAVGRRIAEDFINQFPAGANGVGLRRFAVNLIGDYNEDLLEAFRDTLSGVAGVQADTMQTTEERLGQDLALRFEFDFGGDTLRLRSALRKAVADRLSLEPRIMQAREGSLDLRMEPRPVSKLEMRLDGGDETAENKKDRDQLAKLYEERSSPQIAVLINAVDGNHKEEAKRDEKKDERKDADQPKPSAEPSVTAPSSGGGGVTVVVNPKVVIGEDRSGGQGDRDQHVDRPPPKDAPKDDKAAGKEREEALDTSMMENRIYDRLIHLHLKTVNINTVKERIEQEQKRQQEIFKESELARLISDSAKADIIIFGYGRRIPLRAGGGIGAEASGETIRYTFRAVQTSDGATLGAATAEARKGHGQSDDDVCNQLAAETVGKLMAQFVISWTPPRTLKVFLSNAPTEREVHEVMYRIEEKLAKTSDGSALVRSTHYREYQGGAQNGLGIFEIQYMTDYEDLIRAINNAQKDLPFEYDSTSGDRETLRLKLIPGR
jgi:hypothetical protein